MYKNAVIAMLVIGTLAVASCSGGAGAPLDEMNNTQNVSETQNPAQNDGQLSSIEWTAAEVGSPQLGRDASDWDIFNPDFPDWESIFDAMHIDVAHGENVIDADGYLAYGGNAEYGNTIVGFGWNGFAPEPVYGYALTLSSTEQDPAFVTYGFKGFPDGERLTGVEVDGMMGNFFIGVAGYGNKDAYRWYGPYDLSDGPASLELPFMDSTNDSNRGYVTLLTYGGDTAVIDSVKVFVDQQTLIPDLDVEIEPDLPIWEL